MPEGLPEIYSPLLPNSNRTNSGSNSGNRGSSNHAIPINRSCQPSRSQYFSTLTSIGNNTPNSLSGFANSYQRAQSLKSISIEPRIRASRSFFRDDEELIDPETFTPSPMGRKISTIFGARPILNNSVPTNNIYDDSAIDDSFTDHSVTDFVISRQPSFASSIFPAPGNGLARVLTNETDSIILRQIETNDGTKFTMVAPQSTVYQTIFNCINALIGIGLLALSRALVHSGLIFGTVFLAYSVCITYWTAGLLSKCMDTDPSLCTYADIGYKAFGPKARLFVSLLFTVELLGVGVSLIVLFADSLHAMFPEISLNSFKWVAFLILTPFSFLPLKVLSHISLIGIISTISLVFLIFFCGIIKKNSPGSLLDPVDSNLYPPSLLNLFVSYGIILGPFGSHSLFPALRADLVTPQDFPKCLKTTYSVGFFADATMAYLGFFMFGAGILNEITQSILVTSGYPKSVYFLTSLFVSLIPVAKTPINALPIINITEFLCGLTPQQLEHSGKTITNFTLAKRSVIKVGVNFMFVVLGIIYPEFDKIIGLSGSSLCTLICIVLPCAFYMKLCRPTHKLHYYFIIILALILGTISTYSALVI
ncbi:hypothetical protein CANINC_002885 [Pichia inconspicua]|uniref:Amino acid transporter transmembrane domain-containing protein n=1 Tax=Pichia inconspicua TaxID=52247 RepID=A0A4T0X0D3_9ASCO|nr:hypothetical protein CANINC_002885 [[Candida] inconspicua]